MSKALPEAFGGIGAPAIEPMRALLFDRGRDVWARVRAAESLSKIGQAHPEMRSEVVRTLVARLDPAESQTPEDEILVGFVISDLLDLKAVEAAPEIRRVFEEDPVDTSIVALDDALEELGLPPESRPDESDAEAGMRLRLRCTACGYQREHQVGTVYCDLPAMERREKGEKTPYEEGTLPIGIWGILGSAKTRLATALERNRPLGFMIRQIDPNAKLTDEVSMEALEAAVPRATMEAVVADLGVAEQRRRKLTAELAVLLSVAMNLFTHHPLEEVLRKLLKGLRLIWPEDDFATANKSAISKARYRLGASPLVECSVESASRWPPSRLVAPSSSA